jgi:hypothetical protein
VVEILRRDGTETMIFPLHQGFLLHPEIFLLQLVLHPTTKISKLVVLRKPTPSI